MTRTDRPRGTIVRALDPEYLSQQALAHLKVTVPEAEWSEAVPAYRLVAAVDPEDAGTLLVINTEGVGYKVGYGSPLALDVVVSWRQDGGGGRSQTETYLSRYEVEQAMKKGEDVDLADHVRQFGDRLEWNFLLWESRLNPVKVDPRRRSRK